MNTSVIWMTEPHSCLHEELIQDHNLKINNLSARADFKENRLDEMDKRLERMENKIDELAESIQQLTMKSVQDDNDIDKRVTSLETTVNVLKWVVTLLFGSGIIFVISNFIN